MAKVLKVKATKDGYRRAGFGFSSSEETTLAVSKLEDEQIKALKEDQNLVVVEAEIEDAPASEDGSGKNGKKK